MICYLLHSIQSHTSTHTYPTSPTPSGCHPPIHHSLTDVLSSTLCFAALCRTVTSASLFFPIDTTSCSSTYTSSMRCWGLPAAADLRGGAAERVRQGASACLIHGAIAVRSNSSSMCYWGLPAAADLQGGSHAGSHAGSHTGQCWSARVITGQQLSHFVIYQNTRPCAAGACWQPPTCKGGATQGATQGSAGVLA